MTAELPAPPNCSRKAWTVSQPGATDGKGRHDIGRPQTVEVVEEEGGLLLHA